MTWVLLAIAAAAAVAGAIAVRRAGRSDPVVRRQRARPERVERPHREVAHYRASGALPRWDP